MHRAGKWIPAVLYAALTVALFRGFIFSSDMLFGTDTVALGYFARKFFADFVTSTHEWPSWDPYLQGGLPFADAMHGDIFYPTTLLSFVMPVYRALGWKLLIHVFCAGLSMYLWLRHLGASRGAAVWGGAAYLLGPALVSLVYAGHDGRLFVSTLAPLLFWATDRAIAGRRVAPYAVLALIVALLVFTAHMQVAYFAVWGAVGWALFRLFGWKGPAALVPVLVGLALLRATIGEAAALGVLMLLALSALIAAARRRAALGAPLGRLGLFAAAGLAGAAMGAVQLVGPACYLGGAPRIVCGETFGYSQRVQSTTQAAGGARYAHATSWSLHPEETFALLVPEFVGTTPVNTYWGRNAFKLNSEYAGVLGLFLAPLLFLGRRKESRGVPVFFAALAVLTLGFALGATTPVFRAFYVLIPGVPLFRAPGSAMFLFAFATASLGALAIDCVRDQAADRTFARRLRVYLLILVAAGGAIALIGSVGRGLPALWIDLLYPDIAPPKVAALARNLANIERGLWITLLLAVATAVLLWSVVRGWLAATAFVAALLVLAVVDEGRVDQSFIRTLSPAALFPMDQQGWYLTLERLRRVAPFRVFTAGAPDDNGPARHGLEQVQGSHGNEFGRYRDLTRLDRLLANDQRLLRLLNAEFVLSARPLAWAGLTPAGGGAPSGVYRLEGAFPRAFLVGQVEVMPDSVALERLLAPDFDPVRSVLLAQPLPAALTPQAGASGTVRWVSPGVNRYTLEVEASAAAILVVTENFYPAWHARIDGIPADLRRANYVFRAVPVPAGRHRVEFFYRSDLFRWSLAVSLWSGVLVLGVLVGTGLARVRTPPQRGSGNGSLGHYDRAFFADLESRYRRRTRFARRRIANVLALLPPLAGRRLLDIGTGMGTFTFEARRRGASAIGLDIAPAALEAARRVAAAEGVGGAFVRADAKVLPIRSQSVDIVLAADLAEHLDDGSLGRVLSEAHRVLRENGMLVLYSPNRSHLFEWLRATHLLLDGDPSHIGMRTERELGAAVRDAGLRVLAVRHLPSHLPGWNALERALASWVPCLRRRVGLVATKPGVLPAS